MVSVHPLVSTHTQGTTRISFKPWFKHISKYVFELINKPFMLV